MPNLWDERFSSIEGYFYGEEPNEWVRKKVTAPNYQPAVALAAADGEGRNSVWLAQLGYDVINMDFSEVALEKSVQLATKKGVKIHTHHIDLIESPLPHACFDLLVSTFFHVPQPLQVPVWQKLWKTLKPGGKAVIEVFSEKQLGYPSGGPKNILLLYNFSHLSRITQGLTLLEAREERVTLNEPPGHVGPAWVIRFVAQRPIEEE